MVSLTVGVAAFYEALTTASIGMSAGERRQPVSVATTVRQMCRRPDCG
jgi:hypothetical protein